MLYGSTALSLCCLEILVHTVDARIIPPGLVWSWTELEGVRVLDFRWDVHNERLTRQAGQDWINNGHELYVVFRSSYLLNITRPDQSNQSCIRQHRME